MPTFYLAIGARPARIDLEVALEICGQRDLLVPAGSPAATYLQSFPAVRVILDSGAWPPNNPGRPTLEQYAEAILTWRQADRSWGNLAWAASYDHIGNPGASQRDEHRLLGLLAAAGAADAPVVPVTHYPGPAAAAVLLDLELGQGGARADLVESAGDLDRPAYAIGGLVSVLSPTQPKAVFSAADNWYSDLITELDAAVAEGLDPAVTQLHLFGIGRPAFVLHSPLIHSFDSSGPLKMARYGWPKIAPSYDPRFGLSPEKLQRSRPARAAFWINRYRAAIGLSWQPLSDTDLPDDLHQPPYVQHTFFDLAA